uniref:Uncharacterized protein n=1 Tax=Rhizophora mucronata TaxID=61149 RepID=A0A2P2QJG0_RHIMU
MSGTAVVSHRLLTKQLALVVALHTCAMVLVGAESCLHLLGITKLPFP